MSPADREQELSPTTEINGQNNNAPTIKEEPQGSGSDSDDTVRTVGFLRLRGENDDLPRTWWFASTAVPLLAATQGPMSNVLSIAALVNAWRVNKCSDTPLDDPRWEITANSVSLACGFLGNILLLLHFVGRVRYIIAVPLASLFWLLAPGILIAITTCLHIYDPPSPECVEYGQGFWFAVMAAITYMFGSGMLLINILGYLTGHYPQDFQLNPDQRTLILQTTMFFVWLAGGAGIYQRFEGWSYADSLYFCQVSILTIGFGDFSPETDRGRGFLFFYVLLGIIQLGLVISRIARFASSISADKIIKRHQARKREATLEQTVTNEVELRKRLGLPGPRPTSQTKFPDNLREFGDIDVEGYTVWFQRHQDDEINEKRKISPTPINGLQRRIKRSRQQKLLLLQQEWDRFSAMRKIQHDTQQYEKYWSLCMAVLVFSILWFLGALVFMYTEKAMQGMNYFDCLYFCFICLLTIGYGDISPESNIGKPFFIVWSIIAIPSLTVLINAMSDTVIAAVNQATNLLLPDKGWFRTYLEEHPDLKDFLEKIAGRRLRKRRVKRKFRLRRRNKKPVPEIEEEEVPEVEVDVEEFDEAMAERIANDIITEHDLAQQLALAIYGVAKDMQSEPQRRYNYEEWAHFTKLIRFSSGASQEAVEEREEEEGLVEWDWIGEDSPMAADCTEPEWVLERLTESLNRYTKWSGRTHAEYADRERNYNAEAEGGEEVRTVTESRGISQETKRPGSQERAASLQQQQDMESRQPTPTPLATGDFENEFFDAPEKLSSVGSRSDLNVGQSSTDKGFDP